MMRLAIALLALALSACATVAPPEKTDPQVLQAWQARRANLAGLADWRLSGRIGITSEIEGWHGKLHWRQRPGGYNIRFIGPFGQGQLRVQGNAGGVVLQTGRNERFFAADPESLLLEQTGVRMPVSALRYWVLGLPVPAPGARPALDASGRMVQVAQSGWDVAIERYTRVGDLELPDRIVVENDDYRIRLVIDRWQLARAGT